VDSHEAASDWIGVMSAAGIKQQSNKFNPPNLLIKVDTPDHLAISQPLGQTTVKQNLALHQAHHGEYFLALLQTSELSSLIANLIDNIH
jgi:hypothetical protein